MEFAFVFMLLLTLLIGIVSFARAYNIYQTITRAAREGARVAVLTTCATCGNSLTPASTVQTYVFDALQASNLDPTLVTGYSQTYQWLDPASSPPQQCGIAVGLTYPYQLVLPFTSLNFTTVNISTSVKMRLENQPSGTTCP